MTAARGIETKSLALLAGALLTIASGAITVTGASHAVETESGASSDDLDTISGGVVGQVVVLHPTNDAHTVVIKHGTGNIECQGGADITLAEDDDVAVLQRLDSKWVVIAYKTKAPIGATKLTSAAYELVTATATGSSQTVAHTLGTAPSVVVPIIIGGHNGSGASGDKVPAFSGMSSDASNVTFTASAGSSYGFFLLK